MHLNLGGGEVEEKEEEEEGSLSAAEFHHSWQPLLGYHGNALQCSLLLFCTPPSLLSLSLSPLLYPIFIAGRLPPCVATAMLWDIQWDHFVTAVSAHRAGTALRDLCETCFAVFMLPVLSPSKFS